jgi:hypothetical protein
MKPVPPVKKILSAYLPAAFIMVFGLTPWLGMRQVFADCAPAYDGNQTFTIASSCTFNDTVDGVDHGTGNTNDAILRVTSGTLTVQAGQQIGADKLVPAGGGINIITGGTIKIGDPLWTTDVDNDGIPDQTPQIAPTSPGGNSVRYGSKQRIKSAGVYDCYPGSALYTFTTTNTKPVAHYEFNETSAPVATDSAGGFNALVVGTSSVAGAATITGNNARSFNGTSDYMVLPSDGFAAMPNPATGYTVALWIKPNAQATDVWKGVVGKPGRNFNFWLGSANTATGYIHHRFHDTAGTNSGCPDLSGIPINGTSWSYVAITNNGTTCTSYLYTGGTWDTVSHAWTGGTWTTATGAVTGSLIADSSNVQVGRSPDAAAANFFSGAMDDLRIYGYARSQAELTEDMQGYSPVVRQYAGDNDHDGHATTGTYKDSCGALGGYGLVQGDVNDANANVYQTVTTGTDADGDRYITQAGSGATQVGHTFIGTNGYNYYMDASAGLTQLADANKLGVSDCNDNPANTNSNLVWLTQTCYVDADGDTVGGATAKTCTNNATCTSVTYASTGAANDVVNYAAMRTTNTDCNDGDAARWQNVTCYLDSDGDGWRRQDGSNAVRCVGASCANSTDTYRVGATSLDCNDTGVNAYYVQQSHASCYLDKDNDGYTYGQPGYVCLNAASCNSATWGSGSEGNQAWSFFAGYLKDTVWSGGDCNDDIAGYQFANTCYIDVDYDLYPRNCQQSPPAAGANCDGSNRAYFSCVNTGACNTSTAGVKSTGTAAYGYSATQLRSGAEIKTSPVTDGDDNNGGAY